MNKLDTVELLSLIAEYYPNFEVTESRILAWWEALKECPFDKVKKNLLNYVKENRFPPTVADLYHRKTEEELDAELRGAENLDVREDPLF